jgi:hypothetical protein
VFFLLVNLVAMNIFVPDTFLMRAVSLWLIPGLFLLHLKV